MGYSNTDDNSIGAIKQVFHNLLQNDSSLLNRDYLANYKRYLYMSFIGKVENADMVKVIQDLHSDECKDEGT